MKKNPGIFLGIVALVAVGSPGFAADQPAQPAQATQPAQPVKTGSPSMVPPAAAGVFSVEKRGNRLHLTVTGHKFTSRAEVEKYLAYRAAESTLEQKGSWFILVEARAKGDTAPVPKRDASGPRYSFRMEYWRPAWRYKAAGNTAWVSWSPFSGVAFFADGKDPKTITDFEASADIVVHKGQMDDSQPLAFEAGPLSDLLINQVSPPQP